MEHKVACMWDSGCKINSCASQRVASFVWNTINAGKNSGRVCSKDNLCIWTFTKPTCIQFHSLFIQFNECEEPNCSEMEEQEEKEHRMLAWSRLSKLRHTQEVKLFLPIFGIALLLLLCWVWLQEEIEHACNRRKGTSRHHRQMAKTISLVHFDDCDSCVVEMNRVNFNQDIPSISAPRESNVNARPARICESLQGPIIALGQQKIKKNTKKGCRCQLTNNTPCLPSQELLTDRNMLQLPQLLLKTRRPIELRSSIRGQRHFKIKTRKRSYFLKSKSTKFVSKRTFGGYKSNMKGNEVLPYCGSQYGIHPSKAFLSRHKIQLLCCWGDHNDGNRRRNKDLQVNASAHINELLRNSNHFSRRRPTSNFCKGPHLCNSHKPKKETRPETAIASANRIKKTRFSSALEEEASDHHPRSTGSDSVTLNLCREQPSITKMEIHTSSNTRNHSRSNPADDCGYRNRAEGLVQGNLGNGEEGDYSIKSEIIDATDMAITLPPTSIDSSDLGLKMLLKSWRVIRLMRYS